MAGALKSMLRREILTTAFEKLDGKWIWYANAWSNGLIVSARERDLYLDFRPIAFREAIAGRVATEPRRPYFPTVKRMIVACLAGYDPALQARE